jgi:hypothetical protein
MVRVTLSAVRVGSKVKLLDLRGRCVATVAEQLACNMSETEENKLFRFLCWRQTIATMAGNHCQRVARKAQDPWKKKCQIWQMSLRWRRNRKHKARKTNTLDGKPRTKVIDWDAACGLLLQQYAYRFYECKKRQENPWRLWAQTVYGNLNKKRRFHDEATAQTDWQGDNQRPHAAGGDAGFQVCFNWPRDNSETIVA